MVQLRGLSDRQRKILQFVEEYVRNNGCSPSHREIANALGYRSTGALHYQLNVLRNAGYIEYQSGSPRTIRVLPGPLRIQERTGAGYYIGNQEIMGAEYGKEELTEFMHDLMKTIPPSPEAFFRDNPTKAPGHVFISYVREDSRQVTTLQRKLETAGVSVWRDTAKLWPGEDWRIKIRRAITDDALVFIACFSSRSLARSKSYQNEELLLAVEQLRLRHPEDPWLIPVRFNSCEIPDLELGGGRTLASIQRADLFGAGYRKNADLLMASVLRILNQHSARRRHGTGLL